MFFPQPYYWAIGTAIAYIPALVLGSIINRARFSLEEPYRSDGSTINLFTPLFLFLGRYFCELCLTFKPPVIGIT